MFRVGFLNILIMLICIHIIIYVNTNLIRKEAVVKRSNFISFFFFITSLTFSFCVGVRMQIR